MTPHLRQLLAGKPVCVHASMRSFGQRRQRADSLIDDLLLAECTLVVPTFTYELAQPPPLDDRPERNGWQYDEYMPAPHDRTFRPADNLLSLREMGVFAASILARAWQLRSCITADTSGNGRYRVVHHPRRWFSRRGKARDDTAVPCTATSGTLCCGKPRCGISVSMTSGTPSRRS